MLFVTAKVLNYVEEMRKRPIFTFKNYIYNMLPLFFEK